MAIYLIRHGETAANAARVLQTPEVPLSERGVAQAERLARRLAGAGVAHVVSSDFARAAMTAERVRQATGATLSFDARLQERCFGELRGTAYADLGEDPFAPGYRPPGGETWQELDARVDSAWLGIRELAAGTPGHLAVVTHGLVCHSLVTRYLPLAAEQQARLGFRNTALTVFDAAPPHRVELLACTVHLDDDEELDRRGRA